MKIKTSQFSPLDENSMLQAIKRIRYEVYYWPRVDEAIISDILLQDNVWIINTENEEVHPLCFIGMFLISCLHFHSNQQILYHLPLEKFEKNLIFMVSFLKK